MQVKLLNFRRNKTTLGDMRLDFVAFWKVLENSEYIRSILLSEIRKLCALTTLKSNIMVGNHNRVEPAKILLLAGVAPKIYDAFFPFGNRIHCSKQNVIQQAHKVQKSASFCAC